jgi:hypothetical protein
VNSDPSQKMTAHPFMVSALDDGRFSFRIRDPDDADHSIVVYFSATQAKEIANYISNRVTLPTLRN